MRDRERLAHLILSTRQDRPLIRLVTREGWTCGAEVGVLRGKTMFALLAGVPGLKMIGVDQWRVLELRPDLNAETYVDFDMEALAASVAARAAGEFAGRCRIIRAPSVEAAAQVDEASLDFVFIDGDHTERGVRADLTAWAPKVRAGGMVLGHDHHWQTVRRVIDDRCPGWVDLGEKVWAIPARGVRSDAG